MSCNREEHEQAADDGYRLECIDPEYGQELLVDYLAKTLHGDSLAQFERHKQACRYCQTAVVKYEKACRILAEEFAAQIKSNKQDSS